MFIAWAAEKAGVAEYVGRFAWTPSHASWFIKQGAWSQTPEPGALVFFDWSGGKSYKGIDHVGIVEKVEGAKIRTIEANVDRVWLKRKFRDTEKVVGYGLPRLVKEKLGRPDVRATDQPFVYTPGLRTFAEVPARESSPLDVLGTPQALLAGMVITTVIVSFRLAGRRRGTHRRALRTLLPWNAPTPRTATARTSVSGTPVLAASVAGVSPRGSSAPPARPSAQASSMKSPGSAVTPARARAGGHGTLDDRLDAFFGAPARKAPGLKEARADVPGRFREEAPPRKPARVSTGSGTAQPRPAPRRRKPYEDHAKRDVAALGK